MCSGRHTVWKVCKHIRQFSHFRSIFLGGGGERFLAKSSQFSHQSVFWSSLMISLWWRLHAAADLSISPLVSIKIHKHLQQERVFLFICLFFPKCVFGTHPLCAERLLFSTTIPSFHEDMMSVLRVTATCLVWLELVFTIWLEIKPPGGEFCYLSATLFIPRNFLKQRKLLDCRQRSLDSSMRD